MPNLCFYCSCNFSKVVEVIGINLMIQTKFLIMYTTLLTFYMFKKYNSQAEQAKQIYLKTLEEYKVGKKTTVSIASRIFIVAFSMLPLSLPAFTDSTTCTSIFLTHHRLLSDSMLSFSGRPFTG